MAKIVKINMVGDSFELIRSIKKVTGCPGNVAVNIVHSIKEPGSIILLNESSISPDQWEIIANECKDTKWEYVDV